VRTIIAKTRQPYQTPARRQYRFRARLVLECLETRDLLTGGFVQSNLASSIAGLARFTDPRLINPWGMALTSSADGFWIGDSGSGLTTSYAGDINGSSLSSSTIAITIPPAAGQSRGSPAGVAYNGTRDFVVRAGNRSAPATLIFASRDGVISAWNSDVPPSSSGGTSTQAIFETAVPLAVYTGLTMGSNAAGNFLFAANVAAGRIDVFDHNFAIVTPFGTFTDPNLPAGYSPFNVQNLGGTLYVTYQNQFDRAHGGAVDAFDTNGRLLGRLATDGPLNAPWGLAVAPASFGAFGNALLVGNFGDGRISAFNPTSGVFLGQLTGLDGLPIAVIGLWSLTFGNGATAGNANTVYFTAGINGERDGLFGSVRAATANDLFIARAYLDLLQRPVDPTGLSFWTASLAQGTSRTQVVRAIESSAEYRSVVVTNLYTTFLHRPVDSGGLSTFTTFLANGGTIEQVESQLTGSAEYFQTQGHGTNDGFLDALYRDALNRTVDSSGRSTFNQALNHGTTRDQVALAIFSSDEFRQDLVQGFYQRFLGRSADSGGLSTFMGVLQRGGRDEEVISGMVGSPEYFGRT